MSPISNNPPSPGEDVISIVEAPVSIDPFVQRACILLWWSFGFGFTGQLWGAAELARLSIITAVIVGALAFAIGYGITRWITSKLKLGRAWMRTFLSTACVLGLIAIPVFPDFYLRSVALYSATPVRAATAFLQWVSSILVIVLINMPSARSWFRDLKRHATRAA
jgi:hypothetical protein